MQSKESESLRVKMGGLRLECDQEIPVHQGRMNTAVISFRETLGTVKARAKQTVESQEKLSKFKVQLREVEDELVKALSVKTRKEAKRIAIIDSISSTKTKVEKLKKIVQDQRAMRDEYAAIISQQASEPLATIREKGNHGVGSREEIQDAISWYNKVLGFRIEGGHGVKFIFTNINLKNTSEEYSFTIRHSNDTYTLLECDPQLAETKELVHELNRTNGLFKFVRIMRQKFQQVAESGHFPQSPTAQVSATISVSAPVSSVSTDSKSESPTKQIVLQVHPQETNRRGKKTNRGRRGKAATLSVHQSPHFKVKK